MKGPSQKKPWLFKNSRYSNLVWMAMFSLWSSSVFAQKELKNYDRAVYAGVSYKKLGFGEINGQLLTEKQVKKLNHRIEQMQNDYGAIVIFVSLVAEEVEDWQNGNLGGLPNYYLGADPRVERNHVMILFSEEDGRSWIKYGTDNRTDFTTYTKKLTDIFASKRKSSAYRPIRRSIKYINRMYAQLDTQRKNALRHPELSAREWIDLSRAEMDISGDYHAAAAHLHNALQLDSTNAQAQMLLGYACMELQDWTSAATAFSAAWTSAADFETALGQLALHYQLHESTAEEKWMKEIRQFSPDFEEKVYEAAHYESKGYFLGNITQKVFHELFQREIQKSKLEKLPEATR